MHILGLAYTCDSADGLHLLVYVNRLLWSLIRFILAHSQTQKIWNRERRGIWLTELLFHQGSVMIALFAEVKLIASPPHCMDIN